MRIRLGCIVGALLLGLTGVFGPAANAAGDPASFSAACTAAPPTTFVAGQLTQRSATQITIQVPASCLVPIVVQLQPTTQICRRTCATPWQELQIGDRVESALIPAANGLRLARWVDANGIAGYGTVTAVRATEVSLVLTRGYPGSVRALQIEPSTIVAAVDGKTVMGQVGPLQVGNDVYFTGATDTPTPQDTAIWAYRVVQLGKPMGTPQLPATGAGGNGPNSAGGLGLAALLLLGVLGTARLSRVQLPQ